MTDYDPHRYEPDTLDPPTWYCLDCGVTGITSREDHDRLVDHREPDYKSCPSHCCARHGCKYSYRRCPVASGQVVQEHPCEYCDDEADAVVFNERQNARILAFIQEMRGRGVQGFDRLQNRIDDDRART